MGPARPLLHKSHMTTDSTMLFLLDKISGTEKERSEWEAIQIQPLTKAGNSSGSMMRRMIVAQEAPETFPASSSSLVDLCDRAVHRPAAECGIANA